MKRLQGEQGGWALMDAVWSAAVVAMAFLATMSLFDSSTRSADRSAKKSQALIVAQNEMNRMRNVGQRNQDSLLALNATSQVVTYRGSKFRVSYMAVPTSGIGEGQVEACSVDFDAAGESEAMPDNAAFIYMRVDVEYADGPTGTTGSTGVTSSTSELGHATLDSHFAAERGTSIDQSTGMLRVYTLDQAGAPKTVGGVVLVKSSITTQPVASNSEKGCYLFSGLTAGTYEIRVTTDSQDLYMSNASGYVSTSYNMPTGMLRSTSVKLSKLVKVVPTYKYYYNGVEKNLSTATAGVNGFVVGTGGTGNWVAMSDQLVKPPVGNPNFFLTPSGVLMPNASSGDSDKSKMYPTANGYSGFAGPCRANDPGQVNWVNVPAALPNATWAPDATLNPAPVFWLSTLKPTATFPNPNSKGGDGDGAALWENGNTRWHVWGHGIATGQVQVALVGSATDGSKNPPQCNGGYTMDAAQNAAWRLLPGSFALSGGVLTYGGSDIQDALPPGRYDVCVRVAYSYRRQQQQVKNTGFLQWKWKWINQEETVSTYGYKRVNGQQLNYKSELGVTGAFTGIPAYNHGSSSDGSMTDGGTSCGDASKWS